ncbi:MAG TPA: hypothetical protein VIX35_00330 [Vicinamibacterales bacterium]
MPFIRYARDKRGYESTYVMHAYRPGQGPQRARVLYLFRTPAHVKIGRKALEPEVMEALEHTHPDLSFDWTNLPSERPSESHEPRDRERDHRRGRPHTRGVESPAPRPAAAPPPPPLPVLEDESPLGRVVGAERAARLRARYTELTVRIGRRSRTPEDRDRLVERMQRLNPEDWGDEAAVRAVVFTVEAEWDAIAAELPSRRRGRRGGRHRHDAVEAGSGVALGARQPAGSSGIIEEAGPRDQQDGAHDDTDLALDADDPLVRGGGDGGLRSESAEHDGASVPADRDADDFDPGPGSGDFSSNG